MLTTFTQVEAERIGRVYGGGILKFELKDARSLPLLLPPMAINSAVFARLDAALRDGALDVAMDLADEAILPHFFGSEWMRVQSEMRDELTALRARRGMRGEFAVGQKTLSNPGHFLLALTAALTKPHRAVEELGVIEWIGKEICAPL
jgi:hypothetical protein